MGNLEKRLAKIETRVAETVGKTSHVLHTMADGQVFDPIGESFYPGAEAFLSVNRMKSEEITLLVLHHSCTAEAFLDSMAQKENMLAARQPGAHALAMMREGVSPAVALYLEELKGEAIQENI